MEDVKLDKPNMLFSVIVTCYKVEKYIKDVIQSVQSQMFDNCEIVAVDDGSPDGCGKILDNLAQLDSRIKVVHQKNGGPGAARNTGIRNSQGEYIFFLDGDDRMVEGILEKVYNIIQKENPDIVASTEHLYTNWNMDYIRRKQLHRNPETIKLNLAEDTYLSHNFYRRKMIVENNKPFGEEKKLAEDQEWLLNNVHCAEKTCIFDGAFYYHFERRADSQVNGFSDEKIIPTIKTWSKMFHDIDELEYSQPEKDILKHRTSSVFLKTLVTNALKTKDKKIRNQCYKCFYDNYEIVTNKYNKMRVVGNISKVIGVKLTFRLCGFYYSIKMR